MVVKYELENVGLKFEYVNIGEAEIIGDILPEQKEELKINLEKSGLFLIENRKGVLVEKIAFAIIELVHSNDEQIKVNLSNYLSEKLNYDYTYLASLFSEVKGITIENYHLIHKIEMVKLLISYDDLNITEIAWKLHYSSVAHLSNQFKRFTGITPSQFKMLKSQSRDSL